MLTEQTHPFLYLKQFNIITLLWHKLLFSGLRNSPESNKIQFQDFKFSGVTGSYQKQYSLFPLSKKKSVQTLVAYQIKLQQPLLLCFRLLEQVDAPVKYIFQELRREKRTKVLIKFKSVYFWNDDYTGEYGNSKCQPHFH